MHLDHGGSMIEVQCQLMIYRGHIGTSKGALQFFSMVDGSMIKLMSKSKLHFCLHFDSNLKGS